MEEVWNQRYRWNCSIFILSYAIMGMATGITTNVFLSYLDLVAPNIVKGMGMYTSISSVLISLLLLVIPKTGYKKMLIGAGICSSLALFFSGMAHAPSLIAILYIIMYVGNSMFDYTYPLLLTTYVPDSLQVKMFSRTMYINLLTQTIVTFFAGKWVVMIFGKLLHTSYQKAATLSSDPSLLTATQKMSYIQSYQRVIYIAMGLVIAAVILCFFLKEKKADYQEQTTKSVEKPKVSFKEKYMPLLSKRVVSWIAFLIIIQVGASIIAPYFPIFLNTSLHIDRGTISTILSLQSLAVVIGYMISPWLEKKLGAIGSIGGLLIVVIPLLLLMPNGMMFGSHTALMIGIILFFRSGFANASKPIQQSLQMHLVDKSLRPAFSSLMNFVFAILSFLVGLFTRYILFVTPAGYGYAYYITSILYAIAIVLLFAVFYKKYNRILSDKNK